MLYKSRKDVSIHPIVTELKRSFGGVPGVRVGGPCPFIFFMFLANFLWPPEAKHTGWSKLRALKR